MTLNILEWSKKNSLMFIRHCTNIKEEMLINKANSTNKSEGNKDYSKSERSRDNVSKNDSLNVNQVRSRLKERRSK
jgi:hypothetical protein